MEKNQNTFHSIEEYINMFPADIQEKLQEMREVIKSSAPGAEEKISYQMPCFWLKGNLVYFAAYKTHIGFYPTGSGITAFKDELSIYPGSKGTVRFPIEEPLPKELISKIVRFRVSENMKKAAKNVGKKK